MNLLDFVPAVDDTPSRLINISSNESRILMELIHSLSTLQEAANGFEKIANQIYQALPFKKFVVFHGEEDSPSCNSYVYRHCDKDDSAGIPIIRNEREGLEISEWLKNNIFRKMPHNSSWQGIVTPKSTCVGEVPGLVKISGAEGCAIGIFNSASREEKRSATVIQLEGIGEGPSLKHIWFIESIIINLHSYFERTKASARSLTPLGPLTPKEKQVLHWIAEGKTSWEAGKILAMSERTVKFHLRNIYGKLNVVNRAQAVKAASKLGLN